MSMLREKQYEACERRLSSYPQIALFSPLATDELAQAMYECSFYASEQDGKGLVTIEELRKRVLEQLPMEALYLSRNEAELMERLLIAGGRITSEDWEEIDAAEGLACRLWCAFAADGDQWTLELPEALHMPLLLAYNDADYAAAKERKFRYDATIDGLLYIAGFLHCAQPLSFFTHDVMHCETETAVRIACRYLKATFEYVEDGKRELVLLHPGLADPYRLIGSLNSQGSFSLALSQEMLAGGMNGIFPEEEPLHAEMRAALNGSVRPEYDAGEAAEDLRLLAKQGVSYQEMEEVLASVICVQPTAAMKSALHRLFEATPHWVGMRANLCH